MVKRLIKLIAGASLLVLSLMPNPAAALEIKSEGEIAVNGAGDVSVTDLFWIDGHFQARGNILDIDGDGFLDTFSWRYNPEENGNAYVMINKRGMTSQEALEKGIKLEDYFKGFSKFVCNWRNPNNKHYGECEEITFSKGTDVSVLLKEQDHFAKETAEYFSSIYN